MMAMDRLQHSHLSEDHRPAVLGRPRHQMSGRLHLLHLCSDYGISFASHANGFGEGLQLSAVGQFDRLFKAPAPGHNPNSANKKRPQYTQIEKWGREVLG